MCPPPLSCRIRRYPSLTCGVSSRLHRRRIAGQGVYVVSHAVRSRDSLSAWIRPARVPPPPTMPLDNPARGGVGRGWLSGWGRGLRWLRRPSTRACCRGSPPSSVLRRPAAGLRRALAAPPCGSARGPARRDHSKGTRLDPGPVPAAVARSLAGRPVSGHRGVAAVAGYPRKGDLLHLLHGCCTEAMARRPCRERGSPTTASGGAPAKERLCGGDRRGWREGRRQARWSGRKA